MKENTLSPELIHKMDAYWRAASIPSAGQIYLYDDRLLKEPLKLSHVKPVAYPQTTAKCRKELKSVRKQL